MSDETSGLAETIAEVNEQDPDEPTYLRADDVKQRMKTRGGTAGNIADAFGSVESLVEACENGEELTEYEGIGPATAESIQEWWDAAEEREQMARSRTVTKDSARSATITFHKSWANALGMDTEDG
jgi:ERCC4-type nuclease